MLLENGLRHTRLVTFRTMMSDAFVDLLLMLSQQILGAEIRIACVASESTSFVRILDVSAQIGVICVLSTAFVAFEHFTVVDMLDVPF